MNNPNNNAQGAGQQDYLDKAFAAGAKKFGGAQGQKVANNRAMSEKIVRPYFPSIPVLVLRSHCGGWTTTSQSRLCAGMDPTPQGASRDSDGRDLKMHAAFISSWADLAYRLMACAACMRRLLARRLIRSTRTESCSAQGLGRSHSRRCTLCATIRALRWYVFVDER